MKRIDSHQHFWHYEPVKDSWMSDDMDVLKKNFMPADLQPILARLGFEGCVAVQVDQTEAETDFLLNLADDHSFIKGVVGWVDLKAVDIEVKLQKLSSNRKLKGFRHILQSEPDDKYMLDDDFERGINGLQKHGLTYDILIYPRHIRYATELVSKFPEQAFVVDHLAKPLIKTREIKAWEHDIRLIAQMSHVYCKVSGMVTEADFHNWKPDDLLPYLDVVFDAFGPQRLMYGSDWPVCLLAASYEQWVDLLESYTDKNLTAEQKLDFWRENAIRFYNL